MRGVKLVLLAAAISLLLAACGGPAATPTPAPLAPTQPLAMPTSAPPMTPAAGDGQDLFSANCSSCHGSQRQGMTGLGPALTAVALAGVSDDDLRKTIFQGRPDKMMPAWKGMLTDADIEALVKFLKGS